MSTQVFDKLYEAFRENPRAEHLSESPSLVYLSSGARFKGSSEILAHRAKDSREIAYHERVLSVRQSENSLLMETETCLEFTDGSGAFVPGLSASFVTGEKATILLMHIVDFETQQGSVKISSIRYMWDQGTVLKQLNVIGSRGNAWPLCSGVDQVKAVEEQIAASSASVAPVSDVSPISSFAPSTSLVTATSASTSTSTATITYTASATELEPIISESVQATSTPSTDIPHKSAEVPGTRPLQESARTQRRSNYASPYSSLFGSDDAGEKSYKRVIGGGGGGYADSKKGLKPHFSIGDWSKEN